MHDPCNQPIESNRPYLLVMLGIVGALFASTLLHVQKAPVHDVPLGKPIALQAVAPEHNLKIWPKKDDQNLHRDFEIDWEPSCIVQRGEDRSLLGLQLTQSALRSVLIESQQSYALNNACKARSLALGCLRGSRESLEIMNGVAETFRLARAFDEEVTSRVYLSEQAKHWTGPTSGYTFTQELMLANALYNADRQCEAEQKFINVMQMPACRNKLVAHRVIENWAVGMRQHKHEHTAKCSPQIEAIPWIEYMVTAQRFLSLGHPDRANAQLDLAADVVEKTSALSAGKKLQARREISQARANFALVTTP